LINSFLDIYLNNTTILISAIYVWL